MSPNSRIGLLALGMILSVIPSLTAQTPEYDLLIRGARIVDGTGNPWFNDDVAVREGRIVEIGKLGNTAAKRTVDARGLVLAPGFIDLHTHSDLTLLADGNAENKVRDGVTLDVVGESGSVAPRDGLPAEVVEGIHQDWTTFTDYFSLLEKQGISMNLISHVAAGQVRRVVMGYDDRPAPSAEPERMKKLMARSMEEGAWGLVTQFESGGPSHPDEIVELANVVSAYGENYTSHIGSEEFQQTKEIAFVIRVVDEARIRAHIFHLKIRAKENWGTIPQYLEQINRARAQGLDITANQYPYTAMFHGWNAFFPVWAREGGPRKFAERLNDPAVREKIKQDADFMTWSKEHGGWEGIVMARAVNAANKKYKGMSIAEIAKARDDKDPADTCIELMAEEGGHQRHLPHHVGAGCASGDGATLGRGGERWFSD